ncbi:polysaccharide biosynthesis protein [Natrinema saccharevitans]|uniref:Polysaccharide biosynthesis protein n=1 Tax=Natrinema saccharevitans TaxID=301967 RepID=A0A1S8AUL2_9EURY|nr:flippase [Natrinema saccharevitans]OLZ40420.1 polysaccharide biosynthesis protein [Natrinema saccharevitans]
MVDERKILTGFKATLVAEVVRTVAKGGLVVLLARVFLTPDEYGLLFLSISVFGVALLFSRIGIPRSTARYVTEYRETGPSQVPHIVRGSLSFLALSMTTVAIAIALFHRRLAGWIGEAELAPFLLVGFFYIIARTANSYVHTLFQGFNRVAWSARITIVSNVGIVASVIALLALGFGTIGALLGYVAGYALGALCGLYLLYRLVSEFEPAPSREEGLLRRLLEYSLPLSVSGGSNALYKRVDTILVGFFLTPAAVGYYTLAKQLSDFIIAPAGSLGFAVSPSYGEYKANGELERAAEIYEATFEHNVLFYVPAAAGLVVVADPLVRFVFGAAYTGAVPVVQVFAVFIVFQSIDKITNDALDYLGRAKHRAISKGATGAFNFGLNLLLIPAIGVTGAAVSTVVSYGIMVAINIYLIHTELSLSIARLGRTLALVCAIAGGMAVIVHASLVVVTDIPSLLGVVLLGVCIWLVGAVTSGLLDVRRAVSQLR